MPSDETVLTWDPAVFIAQTIGFNEAKLRAAQIQMEIRNGLEGARADAYCEVEIDSLYSRHIESWGPGMHEWHKEQLKQSLVLTGSVGHSTSNSLLHFQWFTVEDQSGTIFRIDPKAVVRIRSVEPPTWMRL